MTFGDNFLPLTGWTLYNATIDAGVLNLLAGGTASITFDSIDGVNVLPEGLQLYAESSNFPAVYAPTAFVHIHIEYLDGNTFDATAPLINNNTGSCLAIFTPTVSSYTDFDVSVFNSITVTFYCSVDISLTAWELKKSLSDAVKTNTKYYGIEISSEEGFKVSSTDGSSEAVFNSDTFAMRALVNDVMTDKIYFDSAKGTYVFDGELSADIIQALSVLISPNLYAEKATISELTVDQLDTSVKVQKYLNEDMSDVNYVKIYGQVIQWITATIASTYGASRTSSGTWDMASSTQTDMYYSIVSVNDTTGAITYSGGARMTAWDAFNSGRIYRAIDSTSYYKLTGKSALAHIYYDVYTVAAVSSGDHEQAKNRNGDLLYWTDDTYETATTDETDYPVYIYLYNEAVKQMFTFELDSESGNYIPVSVYGTGTGTTSESGKGKIQKTSDSFEMTYTTGDGEDVAGVYFRDDGFVDVTARRADIAINTTSKTITITPEGEGQSDIIVDYTEVDNVLTLTWPDGESFTVGVTS